MALVNNFFEIRSDAFKITVHTRRPIPARTDTIGPWLDSLIFLTWLSALTNSALVYLFRPTHLPKDPGHGSADGHRHHMKDILITAVLITLASSHGYILLKVVIRHIVDRAVWQKSLEVEASRKAETDFKEGYLKILEDRTAEEVVVVDEGGGADDDVDVDDVKFWQVDEGLEEIGRVMKEA
jgi:anoctamin-10